MAYSPAKELRRKMRTLSRRRDFLGQRLASRPEVAVKGDWDRAEFSALETALELMQEKFDSLPPAERDAANRSDDQKG